MKPFTLKAGELKLPSAMVDVGLVLEFLVKTFGHTYGLMWSLQLWP